MKTRPSQTDKNTIMNPISSEKPFVWNDREAAFYLSGIAQSDYAEKVGSLLYEHVGPHFQLLDIGAGAGTLSHYMLCKTVSWTAIEPNSFLANHLKTQADHWPYQLRVLESSWQVLDVKQIPSHDISLAANTSGPIDDTNLFWQWQQSLTRRVMVWVVPDQAGPRKKCLSGFLPREIHGEEPGRVLESILQTLGPAKQPDTILNVDWTFRQSFADFQQANRYFQQTFNTQNEPQLAAKIKEHLSHSLDAESNTFYATAKKTSAVLIWRFNQE